MADLQALNAGIDLLELVKRDTSLKHSGGNWWAGPCPKCGGRDRFVMVHKPDGWRWLCRGCGDGKYHSAIDYIMWHDNCDVRTAIDTARQLSGTIVVADTTPPAAPVAGTTPDEPPPAFAHIAEICERHLWEPMGAHALAWLRGQGRMLKDETLKRWRVGYSPGIEIDGLYVARGAVIPHIVDGRVWALKVSLVPGERFRCSGCRRLIEQRGKCPHCDHENKYRGVTGNQVVLYGADTLPACDVALWCEGEFDCMLAWQEAGDLCGVVTLGSAHALLNPVPWAHHLLPVRRLLLAFDIDKAGQGGAHRLEILTARAERLTIPALQPGDKDLTDFVRHGGNLRQWLIDVMGEDTPAPARWAPPQDPVERLLYAQQQLDEFARCGDPRSWARYQACMGYELDSTGVPWLELAQE